MLALAQTESNNATSTMQYLEHLLLLVLLLLLDQSPLLVAACTVRCEVLPFALS